MLISCAPALYVWSPAGLPLHLSVRANCQGFHQRRCLPCYRLTAAKHAGPAAPSPHRDFRPLQGRWAAFLEGLISHGFFLLKSPLLSVQTLASVMENLSHTNTAELLISLFCLAVLVPVKEVNMRYKQHLRTPIPVEILTVGKLYL